MPDRSVIITLRDKQTTGGSIPGSALMGEPFVNLYDGILKFSGVTGGSYEPTTQTGVFEVGSSLYNQRITNRLNINDNFIISGDTGFISTYGGTSGAGLAGKFLSGTTAGFVVANIADIATSTDSYTTGVTWVPNTLTLKLNQGRPDVTVSIGTFDTLAVTGNTTLANVSAQALSANTIYSGNSVSLESIIYNIVSSAGPHTFVQPGANITTGGTASNPIISLVASPSVNNITFSGTAIGGTVQAGAGTFTSLSSTTLSGGTILSGSTNLYSIFAPFGTISGVETIGQGSNILTGGTATNPTISIVASPSVNNITFSGTAIGGNVQAAVVTATSLSAATLSGGTILSGSTNLYSIFALPSLVVNNVNAGTNILTGGTATSPTINLVASPSVNNITFSGTAIGGTGQFAAVTATSLSAATLSGGTILSGSTNLYSIFSQTDTITRVQPGTNITTGGTANAPTINLVASPSVNNLTVSGTGTINTVNAQIITATAITDSNLTSGQAVYASTGGLLKTSTGFTYDDAVSTLFAQNINIGSPSLSGTATIWGDVIMMGAAISAFTSQLYIEDNNIQLNYNPTASTTSTSLGAGWTIQDGDGVASGDVFMDIRGASTGVANRSFSTNLNDLRIRETGTVSAPNGVRVLAEFDVLDGGSY
jgi:hypothetical protein